MATINGMERVAFVQKFGGIFENSPWVAEQAWTSGPFANVDALHAANGRSREICAGRRANWRCCKAIPIWQARSPGRRHDGIVGDGSRQRRPQRVYRKTRRRKSRISTPL